MNRPAALDPPEPTRAATEVEQATAQAMGMDPRVYVGWVDADFSPEQIGQWHPVTRTRETGPGTAVRLRKAGVTPVSWWARVDQVVHGRVHLTAATASEAADEAVVWDDIVRHLHACTATAALVRNDAVNAAEAFGYNSSLLARRLRWPAALLRRLPHRWRTPGH